jgi:signal transduction histidine kinase
MLIIFVLTTLLSATSSPENKDGEMDLRDWPADKPAPLTGTWEFYPGQLLTPREIIATRRSPLFVNLPDENEGTGVATYRIKLLLPHDKELGVYFTSVRGSYKIWRNDDLVLEIGTVGDRAHHKSSNRSGLIFLPQSSDTLVLTIQMSSFVNYTRGFRLVPSIGPPDLLIRLDKEAEVFRLMFVIPLLILSIYCIYNHSVYSDRSYLLLAAICWLIILRSAAYSSLYPESFYTLMKRLEYVAVYALLIVFPMYIRSIFPFNFWNWAYKSFIFLGLAFSIIAISTPPNIYQACLNTVHIVYGFEIIYVGILIFKGQRRNRQEFIYTMIGFGAAAVLMIFEMLGNSFVIRMKFGFTIELALLIFLFFQSLLLQQRHRFQIHELQKLNNELDEFLYRLSHDFRTPIASIKGLVYLIGLEPGGTENINNYVSRIGASNQKLDNLLAKIGILTSNNKDEVNPEQVDISQVVAEAFESEKWRLPESELTIAGNSPPDFYSDKRRVKEIFTQLTANAMIFSNKRKANLLVTLHSTGSSTNVMFSDDGGGIGQEHIKDVFKMFFRASDRSDGAGLGLYIVQSITATLKGSVEIARTGRDGTSIKLVLPNLKN